jgi:alpha-1,2-mannosyltransferase
MLFLPLGALPTQLAWGVLAILTALALATVIRLAGVARYAWLLPVMLLMEPVWRTIGLGQINVLLMTLVVVDVLALRASRYGGLLVGLAAAVELTPLIFVLHLMITRRWADAARAVGTFAALAAIGFVVLPGDATRFWTSTILGANNAMTNAWSGNQSLNGLVLRFQGGQVVFVALAGVVACFSGWTFGVVPRGDNRELTWGLLKQWGWERLRPRRAGGRRADAGAPVHEVHCGR